MNNICALPNSAIRIARPRLFRRPPARRALRHLENAGGRRDRGKVATAGHFLTQPTMRETAR